MIGPAMNTEPLGTFLAQVSAAHPPKTLSSWLWGVQLCLPMNLPPTDSLHQHPSANLAPLIHIARHASSLMKRPHFGTARSHT